MEKTENLLKRIEQEHDPRILHEQYSLQDNFAILLTMDASQRNALEKMLEVYPRGDDFDRTYAMFQVKGYLVHNTGVRYSWERNIWFVEIFENASGETSDSNASITFHPHGENYEEQLFSGKKAVIEIISKIIESKIPFETARPPSRHIPM